MVWQEAFLQAARHIVFYGLKRNGRGYAFDVLRGLQQFNPELQITPIHLHAARLGGLNCELSARHAHPPADSAVIVLNPVDVPIALGDVASADINRAWLVLNATTAQNIEYARERGISAVGGCPLLFIPGIGFPHNIHRGLAKMFHRI